MASQLAQFNSLEQMLNMNNSLEKLAQNSAAKDVMDLVNYVGKEVLLEDGKFHMENGKTSYVAVKNNTPLNNVTLQIKNIEGKVVAEQKIDTLAKGEHQIDWNGISQKGQEKVAGIYYAELINNDTKRPTSAANVVSRLKVEGIDLKNNNQILQN